MAPSCNLPAGTVAQQMCLHLTDPQNGYGLSPQGLDEGVQTVQFQKTGKAAPKDFFASLIIKGKGDGEISPAEVYKKILELAPRQPRLAAFLKGKMEIPWMTSTHQTIPQDTKKLTEWMDKKIDSLKGTLRAKGWVPGDFAYTVAMGQGLLESMIHTKEGLDASEVALLTVTGSPALKRKGDWALTADKDLDKPEKSLGEIYRQRKANCLEFTILFFWAAQKAGIEVVPVASYRDILGQIQEHVMVGFKNPQTKKIEKVADIGFGRFGDPIQEEVWGEIPPLELWAAWFDAQGWNGMDQARGESYADLALQMVPHHYLFLYNKGFYRLQDKDFAAAKDLFLASIKANPNYPHSYHNLYFAAMGLGDDKLARWAKQKYFALPENKHKREE